MKLKTKDLIDYQRRYDATELHQRFFRAMFPPVVVQEPESEPKLGDLSGYTAPLSPEDLEKISEELNEYLTATGYKLFPRAKAKELNKLGAKRCNRCTGVKNLSEFNRSAGNPDGLARQCKPCNIENTNAYRSNNPEAVKLQRQRYDAENADKIRAYREANKDKINQRDRERYYSEDGLSRLRMQLRKGYNRAGDAGNQAEQVTPESLFKHWEMLGVDPLRCYLTGDKLTPLTRSIDHVVPISVGGSHTPGNLLPTTHAANTRKHNKPAGDAVLQYDTQGE